MITGHAPCVCGWYIERIELTGYWDYDGKGGKNWRVVDGKSCPACGEPLVWLHQPSKDALTLYIEKLAESEIES